MPVRHRELMSSVVSPTGAASSATCLQTARPRKSVQTSARPPGPPSARKVILVLNHIVLERQKPCESGTLSNLTSLVPGASHPSSLPLPPFGGINAFSKVEEMMSGRTDNLKSRLVYWSLALSACLTGVTGENATRLYFPN